MLAVDVELRGCYKAYVPLNTSWGKWILERSRVVGFKTQLELAAAVGVTRQRLAKWIAMDSPPRMRRGLDGRLARALKVYRQTLLVDWKIGDPERLALLEFETPKVPWKSGHPEDELRRVDLGIICDILSGVELEAVHAFAVDRWKKVATGVDQHLRSHILTRLEDMIFRQRSIEELDKHFAQSQKTAEKIAEKKPR